MKRKHLYIPQDDIETITTTTGEVIENKDILDGAHISVKQRKPIKKAVKKTEPKKTEPKKIAPKKAAEQIMQKTSDVWDDMKIQSGSQIYADNDLQKKYIAKLEPAIDNIFLSSSNKEKTLDELTEWNYHNVRNYLELKFSPNGRKTYIDLYEDSKKRGWSPGTLNPKNVTKAFAMGGNVPNLSYRTQSLKERAEEMVGYDTWNELDPVSQSDLVQDLVKQGHLSVPFSHGGGVEGRIDNVREAKKYLKDNGVDVEKSRLEDFSWFVPSSNISEFEYSVGLQENGIHMTDADLVGYANEMSVMSYAKGGGVAEATYKVTLEINGTKKEKVFDSKEKAESYIDLMSDEEDVKNIKLVEEKPAKEPKKKATDSETPNIFVDLAKQSAAAAKPSKSKTKDKERVEVNGIAEDIARYDELKAIMNNAKAEQELLRGTLLQIGKEKYMELYQRKGMRPESFNLADNDQEILFIVSDAYKSVSAEKAAILQNYPDLLDIQTKFVLDSEVLNRVGAVVSKIIMESKLLSDEDKRKLIVPVTEMDVKKGTIDRLMQYDDPNVIFTLIEPTCSLK
jgi:hypothetical protein